MSNENSVIETPRNGWAIDDRGYVQGGYDTPIFLKAKKRFNTNHTIIRNAEKRREHDRMIDKAIPLLIAAQRQVEYKQHQHYSKLAVNPQPLVLAKESNA